jgi:F-type H+-transporting ATPase subunit gamma
VLGRKGRDYFKRRQWPVIAYHTPLPTEASLTFARELTDDLIARYLSGEVDRVEILYTQFVTAMTRRITTERFLPVAPEKKAETVAEPIFEPDAESILAALLSRYATAKLFAALADALASQHAAQMIAMGAARKNAGELIDALVLLRNRIRQAVITKELLDIVGGAEALK